jgi:tetratricopeptide (TPR) repeat protein/DNA-binding SARP family transcriptional activator
VLGFLVLARGRALQRTELVDALWGIRPPPSATNIIQTHVKHLRRLLDPERHAYARSPSLPTVGEGYALRMSPAHIDLERFHELVRAAEEARARGHQEDAATALSEALNLWQGPPLADLPAFTSHPMVLALTGARREAVLAYAQAMIAIGKAPDALPAVAEESAAQPLDEPLAAMLMHVYAAAGQRAKAFAVYDMTRRALATELGVDPGPDLAEAHATLVHEPTTRTLPIPAELPPDTPGFTGRTRELAALDHQLASPSRICTISGTAGVGKTALTIHWSHRVRDRFPDGQLYVDLRGYDPEQPMPTTEAAARLLEALGVAPGDIPVTEDARIARYRTEIADRRMLVVLDNASSVEQIRGLLPGTTSCFVVVTSRDSLGGLVALHGSTRIEVAPLPSPDANTLLHKLIGPRAATDPTAVDDLVEQCARLPLALRVAAELAVTRSATPLSHLAGELRDRQRRLSLLDAGDPRAAVRTVLSWSYRHLPPQAASVFRALGWHTGTDLDHHAAAALADTTPEDAATQLDRLARAHLVVADAHSRYGMHDLLRAYATDLSTPEARTQGTIRLLDYYLKTTRAAMAALYPTESTPDTEPPPPNPRTWLDTERHNLVVACIHAATRGLPTHAVALSQALYRYLEGGHHADALVVHTNGLNAAQATGDKSGEAHAHTSLGAVHRLLGQYEQARTHLTKALSLHRLTNDHPGEARTLSNLGIVEDRQGHHDAAAQHLAEALAIYRDQNNRHGIAAVLTNLGGQALRPGHYAQARTYLMEAAKLFRTLADRAGEASALTNLGDANNHLGRYGQAEQNLTEALALFEDLNHRYGQAIALANLGTVQTRQGHHELAIAHLTEALALFQETGHRYGEASVHNGLGEALQATGHPDALKHHKAALAIAEETGDRDAGLRQSPFSAGHD